MRSSESSDRPRKKALGSEALKQFYERSDQKEEYFTHLVHSFRAQGVHSFGPLDVLCCVSFDVLRSTALELILDLMWS
jgi:hypothetical protein